MNLQHFSPQNKTSLRGGSFIYLFISFRHILSSKVPAYPLNNCLKKLRLISIQDNRITSILSDFEGSVTSLYSIKIEQKLMVNDICIGCNFICIDFCEKQLSKWWIFKKEHLQQQLHVCVPYKMSFCHPVYTLLCTSFILFYSH